MNDKVHEDIAGFIDGELERDRSRFVIRRLARDGELRQYWQRMHLLRGYLRDGDTSVIPSHFLTQLQERIRSAGEQFDAPVNSNVTSLPQRWLKPLLSTAVAASVAVLALVGINQNMLQQQTSADSAVAAVAEPAEQDFVARSSFLERQFNAPVVPVNFTNDPQETRQRLNRYLLRHNQLSGNNARFGFVSYMPLVSSQIQSESLLDQDAAEGDIAVESALIPATATQDKTDQ